MLGCKLNAAYGFVLEGTLQLPRPLGAPQGLYVEHGRNTGTAILFDHSGRAEFGLIKSDGTGFKAERKVDRETSFGKPARFRLVARGVLLEVYLDDYLIECHSLPERATGRIGLIRGGQGDSIREVKAWANAWQKLPKAPSPPFIVREFKASALHPAVADIAAARPPRADLMHLPVRFMPEHELADVRYFHGGEDGLIYLEAKVKLNRGWKGSLAYGSDGPVKVWVNGREAGCQAKAANPAIAGQYIANVAWKKGANRITFALATNHGRAWGVQARVI
jgi:hypothetical protein